MCTDLRQVANVKHFICRFPANIATVSYFLLRSKNKNTKK